MLHILWTILIGLVVGIIAKLIHPGRENMGIVMTMLIGIAGSLLATFIGRLVGFYQPGQTAGFLMAIVGALVLLIIYGMVKGKPTAS